MTSNRHDFFSLSRRPPKTVSINSQTKGRSIPKETKKPALTLEQTRDKAIEAMRELIEHPEAPPAATRWIEAFARGTLRRLDEMDAQDAGDQLKQAKKESRC